MPRQKPKAALTLADLRARHRAEEAALIRDALRRHGGRIQPALKELGVKSYATAHRLVHEIHPELAAECAGIEGRPRREE